jgi:hypothetical protein
MGSGAGRGVRDVKPSSRTAEGRAGIALRTKRSTLDTIPALRGCAAPAGTTPLPPLPSRERVGGEGRFRMRPDLLASQMAETPPHPTDGSAVGHLLPQGEKGR